MNGAGQSVYYEMAKEARVKHNELYPGWVASHRPKKKAIKLVDREGAKVKVIKGRVGRRCTGKGKDGVGRRCTGKGKDGVGRRCTGKRGKGQKCRSRYGLGNMSDWCLSCM
jgi:hypothetical protein